VLGGKQSAKPRLHPFGLLEQDTKLACDWAAHIGRLRVPMP
jgi:hypothetical protein